MRSIWDVNGVLEAGIWADTATGVGAHRKRAV